MNNIINLTACLPQQIEYAERVRRRERWEKLSAFAESLATVILAGVIFVVVGALLTTL